MADVMVIARNKIPRWARFTYMAFFIVIIFFTVAIAAHIRVGN